MNPKLIFTVSLLLLSHPSVVLASDPTPLYVPFVAAPILLIALFGCGLSFIAPRTSLVLNGLFLLFQGLVIFWADDIEILDLIGIWLFCSVTTNVVALYFGYKKLSQPTSFSASSLDQHRKIIASLFIFLGAARLLLAAYFLEDISTLAEHWLSSFYLLFFSIGYFFAGYSMLQKTSWSFKVCTFMACFSLIEIPLGTILGMYYLWFYAAHKKSLQSI